MSKKNSNSSYYLAQLNEALEQQKWQRYFEKPPPSVGNFNKNNLVPYDDIVEGLKEKGIDSEIPKKTVDLYIKCEFLPELNGDDGKRGFPLYTIQRIEFIKKLIEKWGYDEKKVKIITDTEQTGIDFSFAPGERLGYSNLPPDDFFVSYIKSLFKSHGDDPETIRMNIKKLKKHIGLVDRKRYEDLPDKVKYRLGEKVGSFKMWDEEERERMVNSFRARMLLGFSPSVLFSESYEFIESNRKNDLSELEIYPYNYKIQNTRFYFGDWEFFERFFDKRPFFATPEFLIEYGDDDEINITIRSPQRVDAKYMRRIGKVYTKFRNHLNLERREWGRKTGGRRHIDDRNMIMKSRYEQFRTENPQEAAGNQLEKVLEQIAQDFGPISIDTAKRIVYSKK